MLFSWSYRLIRHSKMCLCVLEWMWFLDRRKHLFNLTFFFFSWSTFCIFLTLPSSCPFPRAFPLFSQPRQTWTGSKLQSQTVIEDRVLYFCKLAEHFSLYWYCIKHLSFPVVFNLCVTVRGKTFSHFFIWLILLILMKNVSWVSC